MKQLKLIFIAMLLSTLLIQAADVQSLVVQPISGSESLTALSDVQRITFSGSTMSVVKEDASQSDYTLSDVQKLLFALRSYTPIEQVETINIKAYPNPVTDILFIENIGSVKDFHLYSLIGNEISVPTDLFGEDLQVKTTSLSQGFYLLQINNQTIKFYKK